VPLLIDAPPCSEIEPVIDILHGTSITDPYRWLEDQGSDRTREWIAAQTRYARSYLDSIPGRDRIRERVRELVDVETYDSVQKVGSRYFFRKRLRGQEQPCICVRDGVAGPDEVLIDPFKRGTGPYTAVKPLRVSPDGRLLLYEVKQGGERSGSFELFDVENRKILADNLPRGYLRGFVFSPDSNVFYYVHEALHSTRPTRGTAYRHCIGTEFSQDTEVFYAGEDNRTRLHIIPGPEQFGLLVNRFGDKTLSDYYRCSFEGEVDPLVQNADYTFFPVFLAGTRILAITNLTAPNYRIVEVCWEKKAQTYLKDVVGEDVTAIHNWAVIGNQLFVLYLRELQYEIIIFAISGERIGRVPIDRNDSVRLLGNNEIGDELLFERESFTKPIEICCFSPAKADIGIWSRKTMRIDPSQFKCVQARFQSRDGEYIPMFLVGRRDVLDTGLHPTVMTSYGGYGISMTPQFSVFVTLLMEKGCIFALPNIRGGTEFGIEWYEAAKRRNRQVAFDDFLAAAEWLIETGRTAPAKLAIFGGSNSGLLVAAAMTQRPDLFRAVLCMVPMLDMLRYHLFDGAYIWKEEFGTSDDPDDFAMLLKYSPYHKVRDSTEYPATMIISGDADQSCNPLHARKMTARLQAANTSKQPILLDYNHFRGHSSVLPLSERVAALTDRIAFIGCQLGLSL
jgi:prolyl oligopeptidase